MRVSGWAAAGAVVLMLAGAPAALGQPAQGSSETVTATGTGTAPVRPANRHSNASILAAVEAAHGAAIGGAFSQAHEYASQYAAAAGLALGAIVSVSDQNAGGGFYGPGPNVGPFGPNQYCGTIRVLVGKPVKGRKPRFRKEHRCFVPSFEYVTLAVTYAASS